MVVGAALLTGSGVALGAFGAHALRPTLEVAGRVDTWETAVLYQLVHGVALLAIAVWMHCDRAAAASSLLRTTGRLWVAGTVLFSGSLYALSLGGPKSWLGPVTPLGGLCFLLGWTVLAVVGRRRERAGADPHHP